jgi:hypothetical protein
MAKVLVVDCITGFQPLPQEHEIPLSPVVSRSGSSIKQDMFDEQSQRAPTPQDKPTDINAIGTGRSSGSSERDGSLAQAIATAAKKMHHESRRRQFGSDMEILIRAFCAEKGWNALISRRRRGCLACAIREAGALGWRVVIRVD